MSIPVVPLRDLVVHRRQCNRSTRIVCFLTFIACYSSLSYSRLVVMLLKASSPSSSITTTTTTTTTTTLNSKYHVNDLPLLVQKEKNYPNHHHHHHHLNDEAQFIIQKSYAESYGRMMMMMRASCRDDTVEKDCIKLVFDNMMMMKEQQQQQQSAANATATANNTPTTIATTESASSSSTDNNNYNHHHPYYPWWFVTLLRDVLTNGAYGPWHHFSTVGTTPPIRFCAIGKNACTEWRRVFKALNAPEFCNRDNGGGGGGGGAECKSQFNTATVLSTDPHMVPNAVFIRDPLERLLSAYLDKCIKPNIRKMQGHCEPNIVFGTDYLERIANNDGNNKMRKRGDDEATTTTTTRALPDLRQTLQNRDKELFAAYVDLLPLKWNVHFVPQAITCDLYRNFHTYDFVGVMGKQFMSELDRMVRRYGGDRGDSSSSILASVLNDTFQYQSKLQNESIAKMNSGSDNSHGTRAPSKVSMYYSARSVRRALEYISIDYVTFGLEVPQWATEMLGND